MPGVCLARGKHPLPLKGTLARGMSCPGKAPTSGSPEVLCPLYVPDSAEYILWHAETGPTIHEITNEITKESLSAHLIQHYLQLRITITHIYIYIITGIRRTNHTIALYDNNILHPLSPSARDKLPNVPHHRRSRHQSWRELHNDARLLDNLNPPTVDHSYKSHTPDTVNHNDI